MAMNDRLLEILPYMRPFYSWKYVLICNNHKYMNDICIHFWNFREDTDIMFAEKDKDHDGKLSFEEFAGMETKIEKAFKVRIIFENNHWHILIKWWLMCMLNGQTKFQFGAAVKGFEIH